MLSKVTTYQLTEEERQAYIKKNPIKPVNKVAVNFKWRGQKAAEASKKAREARNHVRGPL